mmetsp:Transcript_86405/g.155615  ORF Transcript_86405/g.155615 Transcript_86405/m.155615 type:complete len:1000 (-) Transcript_86405:219-3218(-)
MDVERGRQENGQQKQHRGKLYALSDDTSWEDKGTGLVSVVTVGGCRRFILTDEASGVIMHDRPVMTKEDAYQLQGEGDTPSIIVWEDTESQLDYALSFQEPGGAAEILALLMSPGSLTCLVMEQPKRLLPCAPELGNLAEISRMLSCVPPSQREKLATECCTPKFLEGLQQAFRIAEDMGSKEALIFLWRIARGVFLLSNHRLTERYLRRDVFEDIIGMLEYDEGLPESKRVPHRQVLKVQVRFKQVLCFEDAEMLEKIHFNFRLQYVKDVVLPRVLDDGSFASLTQLVNLNNSILLTHLQKSDQLMQQLFDNLRKQDVQSLHFLQDACRLAKILPPSQRNMLYDKLVGQQLFSALAPFLAAEVPQDAKLGGGASEAPQPRLLAMEVILLSAISDASHLRRFLAGDAKASNELRAEGRALLSGLVKLLLEEEDQGVQSQAAEVLRYVIDHTQLTAQEREVFLDVLYSGGVMDELVVPLLQVKADGPPRRSHSCYALQLAGDLLAFAVLNHGVRAKAFVIKHDIAGQAASLSGAPGGPLGTRFLQLVPVRLAKAMVNSKDEAYHRYLAKSGILGPLLQNLNQSLQPPALGGSLLTAATSELLELIRSQNVKLLVAELCTTHSSLLQDVAARSKAAKSLLLRHKHNVESEASPQKPRTGTSRRRTSLAGKSVDATVPVEGSAGASEQPDDDDSDDSDEEAEAFFGSLADASSSESEEGRDTARKGSRTRDEESTESDDDEGEEDEDDSDDAEVEVEPDLGNAGTVTVCASVVEADAELSGGGGATSSSMSAESVAVPVGEQLDATKAKTAFELAQAGAPQGEAASCETDASLDLVDDRGRAGGSSESDGNFADRDGPQAGEGAEDAVAQTSELATAAENVESEDSPADVVAATGPEASPRTGSPTSSAKRPGTQAAKAAAKAGSHGRLRTIAGRVAVRAARAGAAAAAALVGSIQSSGNRSEPEPEPQTEAASEDVGIGRGGPLSHASKRARMDPPAPIPA